MDDVCALGRGIGFLERKMAEDPAALFQIHTSNMRERLYCYRAGCSMLMALGQSSFEDEDSVIGAPAICLDTWRSQVSWTSDVAQTSPCAKSWPTSPPAMHVLYFLQTAITVWFSTGSSLSSFWVRGEDVVSLLADAANKQLACASLVLSEQLVAAFLLASGGK